VDEHRKKISHRKKTAARQKKPEQKTPNVLFQIPL
jgi:hypothetical protein